MTMSTISSNMESGKSVMNSNDVFDLVEKIAATSSKKEKDALVKQGMADTMFAGIMKDTYDPFKVYNVTRATLNDIAWFPRAERQFNDSTYNLIIALYERTITGDAAKQSIAEELSALDQKSAELLQRILCKDMRAGFSESTINRAAPGSIPEFPYMRCCLPDKSNMDKWNWANGVISQEKADGMFLNLTYYNDEMVSITSRQGTPFPLAAFRGIVDFVLQYLQPDRQYHGEALVFDTAKGVPLPREVSNGIMNSVASGEAVPDGNHLVYVIWDSIPVANVVPKGKYEVSYRGRLMDLVTMLHGASPESVVRLIPTKLVRSKAEAMTHYRELLGQGKEGTILKYGEAIWKDGTSKDQVKLKLQVDVDLVAKAIVQGKTGTKNEGRPGSISMESSCGKLKVDVTVKNEAMRDAIEKNPENFLEKIYVVRANLVMSPSESSDYYSLFLPRLVEDAPRIDKSTADSLESIQDQFKAATE